MTEGTEIRDVTHRKGQDGEAILSPLPKQCLHATTSFVLNNGSNHMSGYDHVLCRKKGLSLHPGYTIYKFCDLEGLVNFSWPPVFYL